MKNKLKNRKRYAVTETSPSLFHAFNNYIFLFIIPLLVLLRALFLLHYGGSTSKEGLLVGIWILFVLIASVLIGLFVVLNKYWLKWRLNWWRSLLISLVLFLLSTFLFGLFIKMGA